MKEPNPQQVSGETQSICLVTALTVSDFIDPDLTADAHANTGAQLGVLTLAALLRRQNYVPTIINLDDLFFEFVRLDKSRPTVNHDWLASSQPRETFFSFVAEHLPSEGFDVYGLSSICSSYPLTLRLAQEIRRLNPHARIILEALKRYGMFVADNGHDWLLSISPDRRFSGLETLARVKGSDFEVIVPTGPTEGPRTR